LTTTSPNRAHPLTTKTGRQTTDLWLVAGWGKATEGGWIGEGDGGAVKGFAQGAPTSVPCFSDGSAGP
jgi:hypothetical protein